MGSTVTWSLFSAEIWLKTYFGGQMPKYGYSGPDPRFCCFDIQIMFVQLESSFSSKHPAYLEKLQTFG